MLHEFAIDPCCLKDWGNFRTIVSGLGISHGRLVSEFPEAWLKVVERECAGFTFRQRQIMGDELARVKKCALVKSKFSYESQKTWLSNAVMHYRVFRAIVASQLHEQFCNIALAGEITDSHQLWKVPRERKIDRTPEELGKAISKLLQMSDRIIFVDRNFHPASQKWQLTLRKFMETACEGRTYLPMFEYHFVIKDEHLRLADRRLSFCDYCQETLGRVVPPGTKLKLCRLEQIPMGEGIHPRYILTERGGIRIDWGLDKGRIGQTTDVSLMDENLWLGRWHDFQENSGVFQFLESHDVTGNAVSGRRRPR